MKDSTVTKAKKRIPEAEFKKEIGWEIERKRDSNGKIDKRNRHKERKRETDRNIESEKMRYIDRWKPT